MSKRREKKQKSADRKLWRVLDANLNRSREGLRVIEDTVRFIWNDRILYGMVRSSRHCLDRTAKRLYSSLIISRMSREDPGKEAVSQGFASVRDLVCANCRRVEESLRVLEEYSRLIDRRLTGEFQKIRFDMYRAEQKIFKRIRKKTHECNG